MFLIVLFVLSLLQTHRILYKHLTTFYFLRHTHRINKSNDWERAASSWHREMRVDDGESGPCCAQRSRGDVGILHFCSGQKRGTKQRICDGVLALLKSIPAELLWHVTFNSRGFLTQTLHFRAIAGCRKADVVGRHSHTALLLTRSRLLLCGFSDHSSSIHLLYLLYPHLGRRGLLEPSCQAWEALTILSLHSPFSRVQYFRL